MASCFKCAVVDRSQGVADPIGVCQNCSSLACFDHGTRLAKIAAFKCVLCVVSDLLDSSGLIVHEAPSEPPPGGDGGSDQPAGTPSPGGGGERQEIAVVSHNEFELSPVTARIAELSATHRQWALETVDGLIDQLLAFGDQDRRPEMVSNIVVTSDETTVR